MTGILSQNTQNGSSIFENSEVGIKVVETARAEAEKLIEKDPELKKYSILASHISRSTLTHLE